MRVWCSSHSMASERLGLPRLAPCGARAAPASGRVATCVLLGAWLGLLHALVGGAALAFALLPPRRALAGLAVFAALALGAS